MPWLLCSDGEKLGKPASKKPAPLRWQLLTCHVCYAIITKPCVCHILVAAVAVVVAYQTLDNPVLIHNIGSDTDCWLVGVTERAGRESVLSNVNNVDYVS